MYPLTGGFVGKRVQWVVLGLVAAGAEMHVSNLWWLTVDGSWSHDGGAYCEYNRYYSNALMATNSHSSNRCSSWFVH